MLFFATPTKHCNDFAAALVLAILKLRKFLNDIVAALLIQRATTTLPCPTTLSYVHGTLSTMLMQQLYVVERRGNQRGISLNTPPKQDALFCK